MRAAALFVCTTLLLAACGGGSRPGPAVSNELETRDRAARLAFAQDQYAQAATLYQAVVEQALAEDRAQAIIDARFNLALSQTYLGEYQAAMEQVALADGERRRRGLGEDPELRLLRANIQYRAGDSNAADRALADLLEAPATPVATRERAHFIAGLIAAERADAAGLEAHRAALAAATSASAVADREELAAHLAAVRGEVGLALELFERTIAQRTAERDHRGMTRALAAAGDLAESAGQTQRAAAYLLRAGRSAAQRGVPGARDWLTRARVLGERAADPVLADEATAVLRRLDDRAAVR